MHNFSECLVILLTCLSFFAGGGIQAADGKKESSPVERTSILVDNKLLEDPSLMVRTKLLGIIDEKQAEWEKNYNSLQTTADIERYKQVRKDYFWKQLGQLWEKTPLNPRITATFAREQYRVEKIVLETLPGFFATGTMFLPLESKFAPPYPTVLVVCGHSNNGKAAEFYQGICILGAMNGLAMYIQDPIDQGERFQYLKENGKPHVTSVAAHNLVGSGSILLGRNTASFEVWDMVRALDYLQSRSDVVADRLGVAGNSGGGTQTSYIMSLDDRVKVAAPSCYICNTFDNLTHTLGPQDAEQNIFGQIAFGMDHADYLIMRAPNPTLICSKTSDFFFIEDTWKSYRFAKRIYTRYRMAGKMSIIEVDGKHGYCPELLESTIRWMLRWLAGRDEMITCPDKLPLLTDDEIKSVPDGIMELENARTTYDLNRDLSVLLAEKRKLNLAGISQEGLAALIRKAAGIRLLDELAQPKTIPDVKGSTDFILEPEDGIYLPVRVEHADAAGSNLLLVVSENGRRSNSVNAILDTQSADGTALYCVELRGWGETQNTGAQYYSHEWFGTDGIDYYYAYLLGKSFIGMRTEDLLVTARYLKETTGKIIEIIADGPSAGIIVLHAAAVEPALFEKINVADNIPTWTSLVEKSPTPIRLTDTIHGVLNYYDIDNLRR